MVLYILQGCNKEKEEVNKVIYLSLQEISAALDESFQQETDIRTGDKTGKLKTINFKTINL